ncbi:type IV secretion system DNA-binding domain-containing protein [Candidatus Dojkabacteria bacterium]|nr:type IV secretion system DNA-binding domain-containing protein [Candidatus Dojkabacteria bacterium]
MEALSFLDKTITIPYGDTSFSVPLFFILLALLVTLLFTLLYFIYLPIRNAHYKKFYLFELRLPDITGEETENFIEKMGSIFSQLWNSYRHDKDVFSIEILKVEPYTLIQIGSNTRENMKTLRKHFSDVPNSRVFPVNKDNLKKFDIYKAKTIRTTEPFFTIKRNKQFVENLINYLSLLKFDEKNNVKEQAGIQLIFRSVLKKSHITSAKNELYTKGDHALGMLKAGKEPERDMYDKKAEDNIFKVQINLIANSQPHLNALEDKFSSLNFGKNKFISKPVKVKDIIERYLRPEKTEPFFLTAHSLIFGTLFLYIPLLFKGFRNSMFKRSLKGSYLTSEEIAYIFHPSQVFRGAYASQKVKIIEPNPDFFDKFDAEHLTIGNTEFPDGAKAKVTFPIKNFARHLYIVGMTGKGKSTVLEKMVMDFTEKQDKTLVVFDPHGKSDMLGRIATRIKNKDEIIYMDTDRKGEVFTFNPIFCFQKSPEYKIAIVDMIYGILRNEVKEQAGMENTGAATFNSIRDVLEIGVEFADAYFYFLTKTKELNRKDAEKIVKRKTLSLSDLPLLLNRKYSYIKMLKEVFCDYSSPVTTLIQKEIGKEMPSVISAVKARFKPLLHRSVELITEGNQMNLEDLINSGKTFLFPVQDTTFGETGAKGIMQCLVGMMWLIKKDMPSNSKELFLFIDECQKVQLASMPQLLSEARKYKLYVLLAHQYFKQLREDTMDAILGNAGTIISFTLSPDEAERISTMFGGIVSVQDLANLPQHNAYLRTEGEKRDPLAICSFETIKQPDCDLDTETIETINNRSLKHWGEQKTQLEKRIYKKREDAFEYFLGDS